MLNPDPYEYSPSEEEAFERMTRDQEERERAEYIDKSLTQERHELNVAICNAILNEGMEDERPN